MIREERTVKWLVETVSYMSLVRRSKEYLTSNIVGSRALFPGCTPALATLDN